MDLDAKKIDSDYPWNGTSDLFFMVRIPGAAGPIYTPTFEKDYSGGVVLAPFLYSEISADSPIFLDILDDDSGGEILEFLASTNIVINRSNSTHKAAAAAKYSAFPTVGGLTAHASTSSESNETTIHIAYPSLLIQGKAFEEVADTATLTVGPSGQSSAKTPIIRNGRIVGHAILHTPIFDAPAPQTHPNHTMLIAASSLLATFSIAAAAIVIVRRKS